MKKIFLLNLFLTGPFLSTLQSTDSPQFYSVKVALTNKEVREQILTTEQIQLIASIINRVSEYSNMLWDIDNRLENGEEESEKIHLETQIAHNRGNEIFTLIGENQREQLLESGLKGEDILLYVIKGFREAGIHPHCWSVFHHYSAQFIDYEWLE